MHTCACLIAVPFLEEAERDFFFARIDLGKEENIRKEIAHAVCEHE